MQSAKEYFLEDVYLFNIKKESDIITDLHIYVANVNRRHIQFPVPNHENSDENANQTTSESSSDNEDSSVSLLESPTVLEQKLIELNKYWIGEDAIDDVIDSEILPFESIQSVLFFFG